MKFTDTTIDGAYLVELDEIGDERGFFARIFCQSAFAEQGLVSDVVQANLSHNTHKATVRGLHFQIAPAPETKLVRCIRGSVMDVIVDLRPDSRTYLQQYQVELNADNRQSLFIPAMVAHGFQTLCDDTEVMYLVSGFYNPTYERGVRADDPMLAIDWPLPIACQSAKDANWPLLSSRPYTFK